MNYACTEKRCDEINKVNFYKTINIDLKNMLIIMVHKNEKKETQKKI